MKKRAKYNSVSFRQVFWITLINLLCSFVAHTAAKNRLCEIETGQSNIILDIEESRGNFFEQRTTPNELPIIGDPFTEIVLELVFAKGPQLFLLNGKSLQLLQHLDRDKENLSHIIFQITCTIRSSRRKKNIPVIVRVSDINDNPPVFLDTPYQASLSEATPVDTTVFSDLIAKDLDAGVNGLVEYSLIEGSKNATDFKENVSDGFGTFSIPFPNRGQIVLAKNLDYEQIQKYYLTIVASDRARNVSERLSSTAIMTITVLDADDQDPSFIYSGCTLLNGACINPEYTASIVVGSSKGYLSIEPERIQAVDLDTINSPIRYSFLKGTPENYNEFFEIEADTGSIKQIKNFTNYDVDEFVIIVKAEEMSDNKRFTTAKLMVTLKKKYNYLPQISASTTEGFIDEMASIGTFVRDKTGKIIQLKITNDESIPAYLRPEYFFEVTTTSFSVLKNGSLVVNEKNLDYDQFNHGNYRFQVVAREKNSNAASAPLSIQVTLNKRKVVPKRVVKTNYAKVNITAGSSSRTVYQTSLNDVSAMQNSHLVYSIYNVTNNGGDKFEIDSKSGLITSRGKFFAGEEYIVTIQVTDKEDLLSVTVLAVTVLSRPESPPKFPRSIYQTEVSEAVPLNTTVLKVQADSQSNIPLRYRIASGDDLKQFYIQNNGDIRVIRRLDREDLTRYELIIRAEDEDGLATSATVNIRVTDINDNSPEFDQDTPYTFAVDEGRNNTLVGVIQAHDRDEGVNAKLTYHIPDYVPFTVNSSNGEIRTKEQLDYEKRSVYKFPIIAKDSAIQPKSSSSNVVVNVRDIPDERPIFLQESILVKVPENVPNYLVATVTAHDPDLEKHITYQLKDGRNDLFKIHPKSGQIETIKPLDYEDKKLFNLIVGTVENNGTMNGDVIKVTVEVLDRNDNAPTFLFNNKPIIVRDDQAIGTKIAEVLAEDKDASYPNNAIRYELVGQEEALPYFSIDPQYASVIIKKSLKNISIQAFRLDIRAHDLGEPLQSAITSLVVSVNKSRKNSQAESSNTLFNIPSNATNSNAINFEGKSNNYTFYALESVNVNSTIGHLTISMQNNYETEFVCEIIKGDTQNVFKTIVIKNLCAIVLNKPLDYENQNVFKLEIVPLLKTNFNNNVSNSAINVTIIVQDQNDNLPVFVFDEYRNQNEHNQTYYGVMSPEATIGTTVLQIKAVDRDSGPFGKLVYRIFDKDAVVKASHYFTINSVNGILKLRQTIKWGIRTPLIFHVESTDNNGDNSENTALRAVARIVINFITDINRLALEFSDSTPQRLRDYQKEIHEILTQKSNGCIVKIECFCNRRYINSNGYIEDKRTGVDIWFYLIDPVTEKILDKNAIKNQTQFLTKEAQMDIVAQVSYVTKATAKVVHGIAAAGSRSQETKLLTTQKSSIFPNLFLTAAITILVFGIVGILYLRNSWMNYKNIKPVHPYAMNAPSGRLNVKQHNSLMPEITTLNTGTSNQLKNYETQVLGMSVQSDDDDSKINFIRKKYDRNISNSRLAMDQNGRGTLNAYFEDNSLNSCKLSKEKIPPMDKITATGTFGKPHDRGTIKINVNNQRQYSPDNEEDTSSTNYYSSLQNCCTWNENNLYRNRDKSHLNFIYSNDIDGLGAEATTEL